MTIDRFFSHRAQIQVLISPFAQFGNRILRSKCRGVLHSIILNYLSLEIKSRIWGKALHRDCFKFIFQLSWTHSLRIVDICRKSRRDPRNFGRNTSLCTVSWLISQGCLQINTLILLMKTGFPTTFIVIFQVLRKSNLRKLLQNRIILPLTPKITLFRIFHKRGRKQSHIVALQ